MTQDDKSLNVLKNLKECFSQMLYLFPKALLFSCIIYLPVFISKGMHFINTGEFTLYSGWITVCGNVLGFAVLYICGEFLALRKLDLQEFLSASMFVRFLKTVVSIFIVSFVLIIPFFILVAVLSSPDTSIKGNPVFEGLFVFYGGLLVSIHTLISTSIIWKQFGIFKSFGYCLKITRGFRFKLLGPIAINMVLSAVLGALNLKFNSQIIALGVSAVSAKFILDFLILILLSLFTSLFLVKIFIRLEEFSGCDYLLRSDESIKEAVAKEEVAVYQNA